MRGKLSMQQLLHHTHVLNVITLYNIHTNGRLKSVVIYYHQYYAQNIKHLSLNINTLWLHTLLLLHIYIYVNIHKVVTVRCTVSIFFSCPGVAYHLTLKTSDDSWHDMTFVCWQKRTWLSSVPTNKTLRSVCMSVSEDDETWKLRACCVWNMISSKA